MLRDVFGRDVPAWEELALDKELRQKWRGPLGAHATRPLITTYCGVVRERWSVAKELTNNKVSTLQNHYSIFEGRLAEARAKRGMEHRTTSTLWWTASPTER